jgi:CubicO group peptidase (beta-lactamase class C family)
MTRILLLVGALVSTAGFAGAAEISDKELLEHIHDQMNAGRYVGLIIGTIEDGDTTIQSFGETEKGNGKKPTVDTLFEISSVAKTFVTTILADMISKKQLRLSDPFNGFTPPDTRLADFEGTEVTLEHLATHYAGLPYAPEDYEAVTEINPYESYTEEDLWKSVRAFEPVQEPGEKYGYSAFGYGLLAKALEAQGKAPFFDLVRKHITEPLSMKDTVGRPGEGQVERLAVGYDPHGRVAPPLNQGALEGAGSMYSTLNDLLLYLRAHMGITKGELPDAMRMTHEVRGKNGLAALAWRRTEGHEDRSQYGTANGYRAFVGFLADGSKGVVVLSNTKEGTVELGKRLLLGSDAVELQ